MEENPSPRQDVVEKGGLGPQKDLYTGNVNKLDHLNGTADGREYAIDLYLRTGDQAMSDTEGKGYSLSFAVDPNKPDRVVNMDHAPAGQEYWDEAKTQPIERMTLKQTKNKEGVDVLQVAFNGQLSTYTAEDIQHENPVVQIAKDFGIRIDEFTPNGDNKRNVVIEKYRNEKLVPLVEVAPVPKEKKGWNWLRKAGSATAALLTLATFSGNKAQGSEAPPRVQPPTPMAENYVPQKNVDEPRLVDTRTNEPFEVPTPEITKIPKAGVGDIEQPDGPRGTAPVADGKPNRPVTASDRLPGTQ